LSEKAELADTPQFRVLKSGFMMPVIGVAATIFEPSFIDCRTPLGRL